MSNAISEELGFEWPPNAADKADALDILKDNLRLIEEYDQNYEIRYVLVLTALGMAVSGGLEVGFRIDPAEPDWPVAYIELPTGQVSWHMPAHKREFDGHSSPEKYQRINAWIGGAT
jgi:hypothetical protein